MLDVTVTFACAKCGSVLSNGVEVVEGDLICAGLCWLCLSAAMNECWHCNFSEYGPEGFTERDFSLSGYTICTIFRASARFSVLAL